MDSTEHGHAVELFAVLKHLVLTDQPPINGYHKAAEAIGLDGENYQRHVGLRNSSIDKLRGEAELRMAALRNF